MEITALDDFEILKKVVDGEIKIQALDEDLKTRLVAMCKARIVSIDREIANIHNKTEKMKELTLALKQI